MLRKSEGCSSRHKMLVQLPGLKLYLEMLHFTSAIFFWQGLVSTEIGHLLKDLNMTIDWFTLADAECSSYRFIFPLLYEGYTVIRITTNLTHPFHPQVNQDIPPTSIFPMVPFMRYCHICRVVHKRTRVYCRKSRKRNVSCDRKFCDASSPANYFTNQKALTFPSKVCKPIAI